MVLDSLVPNDLAIRNCNKCVGWVARPEVYTFGEVAGGMVAGRVAGRVDDMAAGMAADTVRFEGIQIAAERAAVGRTDAVDSVVDS